MMDKEAETKQERKYELHVHTRECDKYATLGGAELVCKYADIAKGGIITSQMITSSKDLITVLRKGDYRLIQTP